MNIDVVVGGQYGSEAKGHITQRLLDRSHRANLLHSHLAPQPLVNVRVAGPNAGHTAYGPDGERWALRQVPVGATCGYGMTLSIAAGSEIDPEVLMDEIVRLRDAGYLKDKALFIDPTATIITDEHKYDENVAPGYEGMLDGESLVEKIGSTGKGIGAARADRIWRKARRLVDSPTIVKLLTSVDGVVVAPFRYQPRDRVIIEGTQGYGLGLHGPYYPQCTSSDCRAIDFLAMAGLNPWNAHVHVHVVARMYPIRVAGNSGPMFRETSWEALDLDPEYTTVTQKRRRVGLWDADLVSDAVYANGGAPAAVLALTMIDQRWPSLAGAQSKGDLLDSPDWQELSNFLKQVEEECGTKVHQITTSPSSGVFL